MKKFIKVQPDDVLKTVLFELSSETSDEVEIFGKKTTVSVNPTSGTAVVQYSIGHGTWTDWPAGAVSVFTTDTLIGRAEKIRCVATGECSFQVCV